jgi:hypothetical protein
MLQHTGKVCHSVFTALWQACAFTDARSRAAEAPLLSAPLRPYASTPLRLYSIRLYSMRIYFGLTPLLYAHLFRPYASTLCAEAPLL